MTLNYQYLLLFVTIFNLELKSAMQHTDLTIRRIEGLFQTKSVRISLSENL